MKKVVHGSKARTKALEQFILSNVVGHRTAFEVSDVKADGTVFIRFRSYMDWSAMYLTSCFTQSLTRAGHLTFTQTDDNKVRLDLAHFPTGSV